MTKLDLNLFYLKAGLKPVILLPQSLQITGIIALVGKNIPRHAMKEVGNSDDPKTRSSQQTCCVRQVFINIKREWGGEGREKKEEEEEVGFGGICFPTKEATTTVSTHKRTRLPWGVSSQLDISPQWGEHSIFPEKNGIWAPNVNPRHTVYVWKMLKYVWTLEVDKLIIDSTNIYRVNNSGNLTPRSNPI